MVILKYLVYILLLIGFSLNAQVPNNEVPFNTSYDIKVVDLDSTLIVMKPNSILKIGLLRGNGTFAYSHGKKGKVKPKLIILSCDFNTDDIRVDKDIELILLGNCIINDTITVCLPPN